MTIRLKLCGNCAFPQNSKPGNSVKLRYFLQCYLPIPNKKIQQLQQAYLEPSGTSTMGRFFREKCSVADIPLGSKYAYDTAWSVRIRSYSGPYFSAFGLNNSKYGQFLRSVTLISGIYWPDKISFTNCFLQGINFAVSKFSYNPGQNNLVVSIN